MRRSVRSLLVGVVTGTTAMTGLALAPPSADAAPRVVLAAPAAASPAAVSPAASPAVTAPALTRPVTARTVTLVTGDRVTARTVGGRTTYAVSRAHRSGPGSALRTIHLGTRDYVVPVVAQAYLGSTLDPALFEVGSSASATPGRVPVRIVHTGGRPVLPGVTVTADSGGVASGYVTPTSARLFGDALTRQWVSDRTLGHPSSAGLFARIQRISTTHPTAPRVSPMFPMRTLVVKGIDPSGKPMASGMGLLMNVDDGAKYAGFIDIEDGEARVSVPEGHYSGVFEWAGMTATQLMVRSVPVTELKVSRSGQQLTIDARQATAAPSVTTPRAVGGMGDKSFAYSRSDASGNSSLSAGDSLEPGGDYRIRPTPAATVGTQGFTSGFHLEAPGATPAYTYDLSFAADRVLADQVHRVTASQLATVNARHDTDRAGRQALFARYAVDTSSGFSFFSLYPLQVPLRRTEYVHGLTGQLWGEIELGNALADDVAEIDGMQRYPEGSQRSVAWRRGALGAGIPTTDPAGPMAFCYACRVGNTVTVGLAPFTDSTPDHAGSIWGSPDGLPVAHFTLSSGRTVLVDGDDELGAAAAVPAATATYTAVLDVDRSWSGTTKSTRSHTELTFPSAAGAGPAAPRGLSCNGDPTQTCRVLPVLQARVVLPTSGTGSVHAGTSTIDIIATRVQGAAAATVSSASLALRPAGFGWATFPVKALGQGRYRATVDLPDFLTGRDVDVRFGAKDSAGSTFTQTVARAFTLTPAPAPAAAPAPAPASARVSATAAAPVGATAASRVALAAAAASGPWARAVHRACSSAARGAVSCLAQWRTGAGPGQLARVAAASRHAVSAPDLGFGPADIAAAYRLDPSRGAGQTIAIVDAYDNPRVEADLNVYRKAWGLPVCTSANGCFRKVNERGTRTPPPADAGWGVEIALDVQAVSAACPRCRILLVEADSESLEDMGTAVNRAVAMGAKVVSNSYGAPELGRTIALGRRYYTHPGVAMVVSSGDDGFQAASFPAVLGSAIAVGGTSLGHAGASWVEQAWAGAGSGCSAYIVKPAWQKDGHCDMRTTSDVSAVADPETGLAVYDTFGLGPDNGWVVVGGTSLAAPLVAAMIGSAGNAGHLDTARWIYDHRSGLKDVVGGGNGYCGDDYLCTGRKGYDGPTGLGSPRGTSAL